MENGRQNSCTCVLQVFTNVNIPSITVCIHRSCLQCFDTVGLAKVGVSDVKKCLASAILIWLSLQESLEEINQNWQ